MMVRPALTTFIHTFCLLELAYAITWSGPQVTPAGLMAMNGVSPRPTQAPDWNGIPRELRKRAAPGQYLYPPPLNWCGFVSGDYENVLSCATDYSCSYYGAAVGCCTGPAEKCLDVYTRCVDRNATSQCNEDCTRDSHVVKCTESSLPWCGTYSFYGGTYLYNCDSTSGTVSSVEFLADWYSSLGSTLTRDIDASSTSIASRPSASSATKDVSSTTSTKSTVPDSTSTGPIFITTNIPAHRALSGGAIGGIAVGAAIVLVAIAAGIIAACYRQRRRRRDREDHQSAAGQALMARPPATFDPAHDPQQAMAQPDGPYSAFKPTYLNSSGPYTDHAGGGSPAPFQPYDPSQELTQRDNAAVSQHSLHFEGSTNVPSPAPTGYFTPPPPSGISELSDGGGTMVKNPSGGGGGGIPMQLRAGSPPSQQIHNSVHEVPATNPRAEGERWELPSRP